MPKISKKSPGSRYVSALDGLRAICALAVVAYHMSHGQGGGLLGVTVLFVLSGYLVTSGLMREFSRSRGSIDLLGFWKRRVARLMPTVIVFVAVCGAVCALADAALFTKMVPDILPGIFMVINWTKIFGNESYFAAAGNPSPLTHFWSLAIEAQFYLVWPPVFYLLMRKRVSRKAVRIGILVASLVSAILMAILYVPGGDPSRAYYGTDTRAFSLLLGCWLAVVWPMHKMSLRDAGRLKGIGRYLPLAIGPACLLGLVAMMVFTDGYSSFSYYGGFLLCSMLTVGTIAALVPNGSIFARLLAFKPLEWIGKRSFAIYVWHYPVLELMNPLNATTGIPVWKVILELAIILGLSELSYRFVEVPLRALGTKPKGKRESSQSMRKLLVTAAPACVLVVLGFAVTIYGYLFVERVTVAGDRPEERKVMQATLKKPTPDGMYDVVLIGDSVSLGANEQLNEAFPHGLIDTKGERQAGEAIAALEDYIDQGVVGDDVVISIGTNGVLTDQEMRSFLKAVGDRNLWYVNLRSPNAKDIDNNELIDEYVQKNENMHLIDWNRATEGHEDWLIEDGIHLTWDGRDAYAKLVVDTMGYEVPDDTNTVYNPTLLGDVVSLDAANDLGKVFPRGVVDTADGRSTEELIKAYQSYESQNLVGDVVVVSVGNEGVLGANDMTDIVAAVGKEKQLYVVNVHGGEWQEPNNEMIKNAVSNVMNAQIIDWYAASEGHDDWFEEDGMTLSKAGSKAFADLLKQKIKLPTDSKDEKDEDSEEDGESYDEYGGSDEYGDSSSGSSSDYGSYGDDSSSGSTSDSASDSASTSGSGYDDSGYGTGSSSDYGSYDDTSSDSSGTSGGSSSSGTSSSDGTL